MCLRRDSRSVPQDLGYPLTPDQHVLRISKFGRFAKQVSL